MAEVLSLEKQKEWMETVGHDIRKCSHCGEYEHRIFLLPKSIEVPVITWNMNCYKCGKDTPIVWTQDLQYDKNSFSISPYSFKDLQYCISQKYPTFKIIDKKTQGIKQFGNVCVHCDSYQGDWFIMEELLEIYVCGADNILEVEKINVELTDEERFDNAYPKLQKKLINRTIDKETKEKILVCSECWKKNKKRLRD